MAACGHLLKRVDLLRSPDSRWRSAAAFAALALMLVYGVSDQQLSGMMVGRHPNDVALYDQEAGLVRRIEALVPAGSSIYQLPFTDYPVTPVLERMNADDPAGASIISSADLKWSWPSLSSEAIEWNHKLRPADPTELISELRARGFRGIWLDRFGYKSRLLSPEPALTAWLGAPLESDGGRFVFFTLPAT
jgi:phosphoglycerol transferase